MGIGVGVKPKAGCTIYWIRNRAVVSSVEHRNNHSVHVRPRRLLASTCSLISAPHTLQWSVMNLQGPVKADLALSLVCLGSARVWLSC